MNEMVLKQKLTKIILHQIQIEIMRVARMYFNCGDVNIEIFNV